MQINERLTVFSVEGTTVQARSADSLTTLTFYDTEGKSQVGDQVTITGTVVNADGTLKTAGLEGVTRTSLTE